MLKIHILRAALFGSIETRAATLQCMKKLAPSQDLPRLANALVSLDAFAYSKRSIQEVMLTRSIHALKELTALRHKLMRYYIVME